MTTTPTHPHARILSTWENVKRALESAARNEGGGGLVKIVVRFNSRGDPIFHTKPTVTRIEPKANGDGHEWLWEMAE